MTQSLKPGRLGDPPLEAHEPELDEERSLQTWRRESTLLLVQYCGVLVADGGTARLPMQERLQEGLRGL